MPIILFSLAMNDMGFSNSLLYLGISFAVIFILIFNFATKNKTTID
tara:strand:+ start:511 stop:648 length:138 start_codon:yes stop_codon:yes gene_type:complete